MPLRYDHGSDTIVSENSTLKNFETSYVAQVWKIW